MTTSTSKFTLQLINAKGAVQQTVQIDPAAQGLQKAAPLQGEPGIRFNLFDNETLVGPKKIFARRVGYDLHVFLSADDASAAGLGQPDAVITDYYGTCAASELSVDEMVGTDSCNFYSGQEGSNFKYLPEEGGRVKLMGWLEPGESSVYVVSAIAGVAPAGVVGLGTWGLLAGAGVGLAALAAGGGETRSEPLAVARDVTVVDDVGEITGQIQAGSVTDDAMPTWNGAAGSTPPGSTVTVYDGTQSIGTTVSAPDGSWSFTPTVPLSEGSHSLAVGVTDASGAASPLSPALQFTVDTTPPARPASLGTIYDDVGPVTGPVAPGGTTDDTKPAVILPAAPAEGDRPVLIVDGTEVPSTYDPATRTLTPVDPLPDGNHTIGVQIVDPAGKHSPTSTTATITMQAGIQADLGFITEDTGPSSTDFVTSDPTLLIGGTTTSAPAG
ncbi:MAG: putative hemagglutinin/hemolysin-related protein, partial [Rhizobacter sp.]|nr:putative hemagglutinin/hemolysin-related protein [Rhizobacter sp.]